MSELKRKRMPKRKMRYREGSTDFFWPVVAAILIAIVCLSSCAFVQVEGEARIRAYPFGVYIAPMAGATDALRVEATNIGLASGCGWTGLLFSKIDCIQIDPEVCGLAIFDASGDTNALIEAGKKTLTLCQGE